MRLPFLRFIAAAVAVLSIWTCTIAQSVAFDTSRMDRSVSACDDFFAFANGNWIKNTQIPAQYSSWGSFNILAQNNIDILHGILEDAAKKKAPKGSDLQLIGDYYASCMDEAAIEKAGTTPLQPYLKRINSIKMPQDVAASIAYLHKNGIPAVFRLGGAADPKNSSMVIVTAAQGGLSLPEKDYYLNTSPKMAETRAKFVEHMKNMFQLLGDDPDAAARNAKIVMDIQTRLAGASMSRVELRDPDKNYNKIPVA